MPIEIVITQKCDICKKEEPLTTEAEARTVEIGGKPLILCERHATEADKLIPILKDASKMRALIMKLWKGGQGLIDMELSEWHG